MSAHDGSPCPRISTHPDVSSFDRDRFTYEPEQDRYICPMGQRLIRIHDNVAMHQHVYRASLSACRGCPLRAQ